MIYASIVIYKHSYADLQKTLESLLNSVEITKIIIVDNDLSDWAIDFVHPKVVYLKSEGNYGFGYGHNLAIHQYAKECQYFLICNPDIIFEQDQFSNFINFIQTKKEGLFLPKIVYPNGINQYGARLLPTPLNLFARRFSKSFAAKLDEKYLLKKFSIKDACFVPNLSGCFMLFRSSALLDLNGFDERFFMYLEDIDLSRRSAELCGNLYCPNFQVTHLHEQASYTSYKLLIMHIYSAVKYFRKWGWFYDKSARFLNKKCLDSLEQK